MIFAGNLFIFKLVAPELPMWEPGAIDSFFAIVGVFYSYEPFNQLII
jgi:hypothetical protein